MLTSWITNKLEKNTMNRYSLIRLIFLMTVSLPAMLHPGCRDRSKPEQEAIPGDTYKEPLMNVNKKMVTAEDALIEDFINRYQWDMFRTGTGLRYMIYEKGNGRFAQPGARATIEYSVMLLNGDTCYSNLTRTFIIGHERIEPGLDEGIRFMRVGDKAKFILPSHLAFGLVGDRGNIPQKATLVYDVELNEIK